MLRAIARHLLIVLALTLATFPVVAQSPASSGPDEVALEEIIVNATRMPRRLQDVAAAVSVVDQEAIQQGRQQLGLDESIAAVPGVFMQDRYNFAQDLRVSIRGFGARSNFGIRGVKIIVDGIPESLPDGQAQSDGIDLSTIEQIEVLRGPSSALYGNASGGVISLQTERPPAVPYSELSLNTGAFGFQRVQLKTAGQSDRIDYLLNLSDFSLDGYRQHSEIDSTSFTGRLGYRFDSGKFNLMVATVEQPIANDPGGISLSDAQADPRQARQRNVDFNSGEALEQQRIGVSYIHKLSGHQELSFRGHAIEREFSNRLPFVGGGAVEFDRSVTGLGIEYRFQPTATQSSAWQWVAGLELDEQDDDRRRFDNNAGVRGQLAFDQNEKVTSTAAFVQASRVLTPTLELSAGLRYDNIEFQAKDQFLVNGDDSGRRSFNEFSPMMGLLFRYSDDLSFYANLATSFETPTTTELANPEGQGGFNPLIKPQSANNYEMGVKYAKPGVWSYTASLFSIDVENELIPFELADLPGRDFYRNAGESSRRGVELALARDFSDTLSSSLVFTYSDFEFDRFVDDSGNDFSGNPLPGIPEQVAQWTLNYQHPRGGFVAFDVQYVGEIPLNNANTVRNDAYHVANLRFGVDDWQRGRWQLSPFVGINNLSNETWFANTRINAFGGRFFEPAPDRHVYAGIRVRRIHAQ